MTQSGSVPAVSEERTQNQKPALVFLRGLIRSRYHWAGFPDRFSDYKVIQPELPGNGYLYAETTPTDIPAMMAVVRDQVRLEHKGPVVLIAISMGGMIATEWAKQFPQEVVAMHQINTSLANMSLPWERMTTLGFFQLLACVGRRIALENNIYKLTINRPITDSERKAWLSFAAAHPLRWRNVFVQLFAASRYKGPMAAPIGQVFFYNAAKDRLVRPGCTRRIASSWGKTLKTHPDAGHDLPVDAPDWLEQSIRSALD